MLNGVWSPAQTLHYAGSLFKFKYFLIVLGLMLLVAALACGDDDSDDTGPVSTSGSEALPTAVPQAAGAVPDAEPAGELIIAQHWVTPPTWLDPQENLPIVSMYSAQYALQDAMLKNLPGKVSAPSLAESFEVTLTSATFVLRDGVKFHNGEPVTPEDVKWTYENYRGTLADLLHGNTESIELLDDRTIKFNFNKPFLDFLMLYGSMATGAGWVVPAQYYQEVGPDGYKEKPIGAGPYRLVSQEAGVAMEFEAMSDYWRATPNIKSLKFRMVLDAAQRLAMIKSGVVDLIYFVNQTPGHLDNVIADPNLRIAPSITGPFSLEFPGWQNPENPFNDVRVREAVSLALDRQTLSDVETNSYAPISGNWIPEEMPGAIEWPKLAFDLDRAKQLMADAGYADGFDVDGLTPFVGTSLGERIIGQLRGIGIKASLAPMEPAAFLGKLRGGVEEWPGVNILMPISYVPGDWSSAVRPWATCNGFSSRICVPQIDEWFEQYDASQVPAERDQLARNIQEHLLSNHIFVPIYTNAFVGALGPRIANDWQEIFLSVPQYPFVGPYEDIRLNP